MYGVSFIMFTAVWWLNDIGLLLFLIANLYYRNKDRLGALDCYSLILIYARLTHSNLVTIPQNFHLIATFIQHIIIFFMAWFIYTTTDKNKILFIGITCLSFIPNYYNPYEINKLRLMIRVILYFFLTNRIKKPDEGRLPIPKYIMLSWILFTHEIFWIFIPFQVVYDTYNYKINNGIV